MEESKKNEITKKPATKPSVNFTVSKKGPREWTVKKDGVDRYYRFTTKGSAFADAESKIKAVSGRSGRIKIHEDGKYTSNWFIEANKVAKLASGSNDKEILDLIEEQKKKIKALQDKKVVTLDKTTKEDALKIAKEAKVTALEAKEENKKLQSENKALTQEVKILKNKIAEVDTEPLKRSKIETGILIFILLLTITTFVVLVLALVGTINLSNN